MAIFEDYISLKEAGRISGYHPDYIGALIRSGNVQGRKIGKTWMVSKSDVTAHFSRKHYAPISNVFSKKRRLAVTAVLAVILIAAAVAADKYAVSGQAQTGIKPRQSLTETVEPQSTDAQVGPASQ